MGTEGRHSDHDSSSAPRVVRLDSRRPMPQNAAERPEPTRQRVPLDQHTARRRMMHAAAPPAPMPKPKSFWTWADKRTRRNENRISPHPILSVLFAPVIIVWFSVKMFVAIMAVAVVIGLAMALLS